MPLPSDPNPGINSWLEDELYAQYLRDRSTVDDSWKRIFEKPNGHTVPASEASPRPTPSPQPPTPASKASLQPTPASNASLQPLRGAPARIAENMSASLSIPLATSQRTIAVKVMDENRRIINQHRT